MNLTPTVGIRYSDIRDSGYTETGTTFQNLIVKGKKYNMIEGLAGVRMSKDINVENIVLIPAIYSMLDYNFKDKTSTIDAWTAHLRLIALSLLKLALTLVSV
ncbi:MAG: autotransporter outer membrane beta-barrel domain-containing protein [Rickettsia conorii subsp. raoultii]